MTIIPQSDSEQLVTHTLSSSAGNFVIPYRGIDSLPPEILSHIFIIGSDEQRYRDVADFGDSSNNDDIDTDDDDDEEEEAEPMHFATLCSHVSQRWRNIALDTCHLWSYLAHDGSSGSVERSRVWISRSKDTPLAIHVDLTAEEEFDIEERITHNSVMFYLHGSHMFLDLILPNILRWKMFVLQTNSYDLIWQWQKRLAILPAAPILEHIGIFCYTEWVSEDVFHPPLFRFPPALFPQGTPNIRSVILWGVHFDWNLVTFFAGLESLHLAWHTKDVCPTVEQFVQALSRSPKLETLNLEGSAPQQGIWPQERILLPKLRRFGLEQIGLSDAVSIVDHIDFPALTALKLDLEVENVHLLIRAFCQSNKSPLGSLQTLRVSSFQCSPDDGKLFLSALVNVKSMILDFNFLPSHFCDTLNSSPLMCPKLEMLKLSGLTSKRIKALIKARKRSPTPIRRLFLDEDDNFSERTVEWLKKRVETVEFFENSDVEEDEEEDEESDEEEDEESDEEGDEDDWTDDTGGSNGTSQSENDDMEREGF